VDRRRCNRGQIAQPTPSHASSIAFGGQAGTSSLIRNYLGFPRGISGAELAAQAHRQAWLFGANFYFMRRATGCAAEERS
jgi:thioredoxin reductase